MGYRKASRLLLFFIIPVLVTLLISSCNDNKYSEFFTNDEYKELNAEIKDSLKCNSFEVISCENVDEEYIYKTDVFKKHYDLIVPFTKEVVDTFQSCYNYAKSTGEYDMWSKLGVSLSMCNEQLKCSKIKILYGIVLNLFSVEEDINDNFDSLFSKETLYYIDSSVLELKRRQNKMEKEFYKAFYISPFLVSSFSSEPQPALDRCPIVLGVKCDDNTTKKVFVFKFDSEEGSDKKYDIGIVGIK